MDVPIDYSIEKGVAIPGSKGLPLGSLEVGDSIQFPAADRPRVANQVSYLHRKTTMKFTIHKENDNKCRVWRKA